MIRGIDLVVEAGVQSRHVAYEAFILKLLNCILQVPRAHPRGVVSFRVEWGKRWGPRLADPGSILARVHGTSGKPHVLGNMLVIEHPGIIQGAFFRRLWHGLSSDDHLHCGCDTACDRTSRGRWPSTFLEAARDGAKSIWGPVVSVEVV